MKTEKYLRRDTEQGSLTTTPPGDGLAPDPRQTFCMCFSRGKPVSRSQQKESWGVIRKEGVQVGSWRPRVKSYKESSVSNTQRYKGSNNTDTGELERAALLHMTQIHGYHFYLHLIQS